ncbi:MAG: SGNH/GDSL hydrolase family protein [Candidatus Izemoplasmatales bacterium]
MEYRNIDIHNIGHIEHHDRGITWLRVPRHVYDALETDMGRSMARNAIGVELRFVIHSGQAKITLQSLSDPRFLTTLHTFYGGVQAGWDGHEMNSHIPVQPTEFVFSRPANVDVLRDVSKRAGSEWNPDVVRVILERGDIRILDVEGDVVPPAKRQLPSRTLLTYGSSITHGSNALSISYAWPSVVAHRLGMDLRNLGMAGSCRMEPEMVDYIAALGEAGAWDMAVLELGINVLDWDESLIRERVRRTLSEIAGRNPRKPIVVISPFFSGNDFHQGVEAARWRRLLPAIVAERNDPNVHYADGTDLLGDMSLLSADEVHPSIHGMQQIADRLFDHLENILRRPFREAE